MAAQDFMSNENEDLLIKGGDFVVDNSDEMHMQDIIRSTPGTWKQSPVVGVGMFQYVEAAHDRASLDRLKKQIQLQLSADGYRVNNVTVNISGGEIQTVGVNAER